MRDVAKGEWRLEADPRYGGTRVYPDGLEISGDRHDFVTSSEIIYMEGEEVVFHRTWEKRTPRTAG